MPELDSRFRGNDGGWEIRSFSNSTAFPRVTNRRVPKDGTLRYKLGGLESEEKLQPQKASLRYRPKAGKKPQNSRLFSKDKFLRCLHQLVQLLEAVGLHITTGDRFGAGEAEQDPGPILQD